MAAPRPLAHRPRLRRRAVHVHRRRALLRRRALVRAAMSRRSIAALCATVVLAACSADPLDPSAGFEGISVENPLNLPANPPRAEGGRGPSDGTVFDPVSEPIDDGVAFRFSLGHCGLTSPIDVDGSFWDPVDG